MARSADVRPDPFSACEALVRNADYDRYLAALFVPAERRAHMFALFAFNYEVAKTAETVTQPIMGQMRLQWWRDALDEIAAGHVRRHDVVEAMAETLAAHQLPRAVLDGLIDARENDLLEAPFETWKEFDAYADATAGNVMRLAARIVGVEDAVDAAAHHAGIAYALTGLLRALPFHARARRLMLPLEALRAAGISQEQIFSGIMDAKVTALIGAAAARAREHFGAAKTLRPRAGIPALLPASLVPLYLKRLTRPGFNPFSDSTEVPVFRRQLAMLAATLGR